MSNKEKLRDKIGIFISSTPILVVIATSSGEIDLQFFYSTKRVTELTQEQLQLYKYRNHLIFTYLFIYNFHIF